MKVYNVSRNAVLADKIKMADTFFSRMKGLLGREILREGEGLLITRCRSIHMLFMRFPIDAVFADKDNSVVGLVERIKPFCFSPVFFRASFVVELPAGVISKSQTSIGDVLRIDG